MHHATIETSCDNFKKVIPIFIYFKLVLRQALFPQGMTSVHTAISCLLFPFSHPLLSQLELAKAV